MGVAGYYAKVTKPLTPTLKKEKKERSTVMSKSELFVSLAQIPEGDPRLDAVSAVLADKPKPEPPTSIRLLRMGQAAAETGLSRCTIWRAIREGRIKAVEVRRGSHRIPMSELQRFCRGGSGDHGQQTTVRRL